MAGAPVTGGFEVVMSDLLAAARVFAEQSETLHGLMPVDGPPCPDGGGGEIDAAMRTVLSRIGALNQQLAEAMAGHAQKLTAARHRYAHAEITNAELCRDLGVALLPGRAHAAPRGGRP